MKSQQREARQLVVESYSSREGFLIVAIRTVMSEISAMDVIDSMTPETIL